jgi:hypothetical protein
MGKNTIRIEAQFQSDVKMAKACSSIHLLRRILCVPGIVAFTNNKCQTQKRAGKWVQALNFCRLMKLSCSDKVKKEKN